MDIVQSFYDNMATEYDKLFKFECEYRAVRRQVLTDILIHFGCSNVKWLFPEDTDFYQPVLIAKK